MLVAGANTRCDTSARVVGLRYYCLISAEALNMLFTGLHNVLYLQLLYLPLLIKCSNIAWPNLSALRALYLQIFNDENWRLDKLLPQLTLDHLTIECWGGLALPDVKSILDLILSSKCPDYIHVKDEQSNIRAKVVTSQPVHEKHEQEMQKKFPKFLRCCLDYYSLGYIIAHSKFHWILTIEAVDTYEVRRLVDGANSTQNTTAQVVGLRGGEKVGDGVIFCPLSISAEAVNALFTGLKNLIHLQELHLDLPVECCNITWPNLSVLQVLHLRISGERNWRLDTLLPQLSLESLTVESTSNSCALAPEDCKAIRTLLLPSSSLKSLHLKSIHITDAEGMVSIPTAILDNESLPLQRLALQCKCTFSDIAAQCLALFITINTTLHHLSVRGCTFTAHGLLQLAQAIHCSSSLQERKLMNLTCIIDGDDDAIDCAQLSVDYPHMRSCLHWRDENGPLHWSHITDRGAKAIATILHHNSTLRVLDLSNNSVSDAGSVALAQALHHNSTLMFLNLSSNTVSDAGSAALAQALHHNSFLKGLDLSNNGISDTGSAALAQALHHNSTLMSLNLSNNTVSDTGSAALAQALHHNSFLEELDLSNNGISDTGSAALAQALHHNSTLMSLNLSNNTVSDTGSAALAQALHHNSSLEGLNLSNNGISDTGSDTLAQALRHNSNLKRLTLSNNNVSDTGSAVLVQALHYNSTLQRLDLSNNSISDSGSATFTQVPGFRKDGLVITRYVYFFSPPSSM